MQKIFEKVAGLNFIETWHGRYVGGCTNSAICRIDDCGSSAKQFAYAQNVMRDRQICWAKSAHIDDKILFSPCNGTEFYLYDEKTKSLKQIELEFDVSDRDNPSWFWEVVACDRDFYAMGLYYPGIVKINADTGAATYLTDCVKGFYTDNEIELSSGRYYFADGYARYEKDLYFPTAKDSTLFHLDCETDSYDLIELNCWIKKIWSISRNSDAIWMTDADAETGRIAIWNRATNKVRKLQLPSKGLWYAPAFYEGFAYFFPVTDNAVTYQVNIDNLKYNVFDEIDVLFRNTKENEKALEINDNDVRERIANVLMVQKNGDKVVFIRRPDYTWFTYNFATGELTAEIYTIEDDTYLADLKKDYYDGIFRRATKNNDIHKEEEIPLEEYISRI